jgi:hypothetical protein
MLNQHETDSTVWTLRRTRSLARPLTSGLLSCRVTTVLTRCKLPERGSFAGAFKSVAECTTAAGFARALEFAMASTTRKPSTVLAFANATRSASTVLPVWGVLILLLPLQKCARACVRECERSAVKDRVLAVVEDVDVDVLAVALTSIETLTFRHATQSGQQFFHPPEVSESRWTPPPNESKPQITDNFECGVAGGRCKHTHTHTHTSLKCLILDALNSLVRLLLLFCVNQASPVSSRIWPAY